MVQGQEQESGADSLLRMVREMGHEPAITNFNEMTGYLEARCGRCNARAWGWYFANSPMRRADLEGPALVNRCSH
jgi:hypothetical protein